MAVASTRACIFLPVMLSLALIGIIWELMYSNNYGLINSLIGRNGQTNFIDWLGNPKLNIWAVLVEASWRQVGYVMVLYLAGLKAVDPTLREAATGRRRDLRGRRFGAWCFRSCARSTSSSSSSP